MFWLFWSRDSHVTFFRDIFSTRFRVYASYKYPIKYIWVDTIKEVQVLFTNFYDQCYGESERIWDPHQDSSQAIWDCYIYLWI